MNTISKIIITSILGIFMVSCNLSMNYGTGTDGNGNVVNESRSINGNFSEVKVSTGLNLYITQSGEISLSVEADENLQDLIMTEVEGNVLRIYASENIRNSASKKVMLTVADLTAITASSGSDVYGINIIKSDALDLKTSSGASMELAVETNTLNADTSSGSRLKLSGKTNFFVAEASSGSDIKASDLNSEISTVKASSGANIAINTSEEITAKASSGGNIKYTGNPKIINASDNVSGSIRQQ